MDTVLTVVTSDLSELMERGRLLGDLCGLDVLVRALSE